MLNTKIIGKRIVEARKKLNISQVQLAQRLFISSQAVGKWERGESMPDIITLNRLAEILDVDLNYFSESAQSVVDENEAASAEALMNQPAELTSSVAMHLPSGKQNQTDGKAVKNLNWDMSRGNWVDADFSGLKHLHEKFSSSTCSVASLTVRICPDLFSKPIMWMAATFQVPTSAAATLKAPT